MENGNSFQRGDTIYFKVVVTDGNGTVAGATVHVVITTPDTSTTGGDFLTDSNGVASLKYGNIHKKFGQEGDYTIDASATFGGAVGQCDSPCASFTVAP